MIFVNFRRRTPTNTVKKSAPITTSNLPSKSPDKAPLLEETNNTSTAAVAAKRRLVPERTVQISDVSSSRFKSNEAAGIKPDTSASKPALSAADSGIYGADLTEETLMKSKLISDPPKALPNTTESLPTVVISPLTENSTISAIVPEDNLEIKTSFDNTIQSAYPNLIDATTSENEGTICGSEIQSRRTSTVKSSTLNLQESNNLETIVIPEQTELSHHIIPFNPLHVILKKDANKYYTTEYI